MADIPEMPKYIKILKNLQTKIPGRNFSEIRRYFSKIAGSSTDTALNLLRTADAPLL